MGTRTTSFSFPDHDTRFDPVAVAQCRARVRRLSEPQDDPDALLLDAERRHLEEPGGLDPFDHRLERLAAAPLVDDLRAYP